MANTENGDVCMIAKTPSEPLKLKHWYQKDKDRVMIACVSK